MKRQVFIWISLALTTGLFLACSNQQSIQEFIIQEQDKPEIWSLDLSTQLIADQNEVTEQIGQDLIKKVRKINLIALPLKDSIVKTSLFDKYSADNQHIKEILKNDKYQELFRFGKVSQGFRVYSVGKGEQLDEIIIFGNDHDAGWMIIRILGDDMQPQDIVKAFQNMDLSETDFNIDDFIKGSLK